MASTSKKPTAPSPAAQRKLSKTNKVNLRATQNDEITVVGIGASAGGLQALQAFFGALPGDTGMAYVVITHLHPEHDSHLAEILQRSTPMPVRQVSGSIDVERDHVYVIPPKQRLVIADHKIDLDEFEEPHGQRAPVDHFFRSLAHGHPNSVGIILSGGDTDGAVGVKAIKEEGGLLMVQDPEEAEYSSMPGAAIATGLADVVLPVKELAEKLVAFTRNRPLLRLAPDELNATLEQRVEERTRELGEANQQIAQARDLFYSIFHANPIPTALLQMDNGAFLNVNEEFLTYFGLERDQVIGHSAKEFGLSVGLGQSSDELYARLKADGSVRNFEAQIKHASGKTRMILASVQFLRLDSTDALISTFIDITERVQAERQIRRLSSELTEAEQVERHRLAQILHDDLQQRLFAIQMQLSFLQEAYEKNDLQAFAADFPQIEQWLSDAIKVTRHLSVDLSPPILHGEGLVEAVIWLAAQMDERYGLKVDIKQNGTPAELDEKVRILVFYTVRELLFNSVKHSQVSEATVRFEHNTSHLRVVVQDKGKGFDSTGILNDSGRAHGLWIARQRLELLGCTIKVNSHPGDGTEAIIDVPYKSKGARS